MPPWHQEFQTLAYFQIFCLTVVILKARQNEHIVLELCKKLIIAYIYSSYVRRKFAVYLEKFRALIYRFVNVTN